MNEDGFCPLCEVTLDLHDGPESCEAAEGKAALLERFGLRGFNPGSYYTGLSR